MRAILLALLLLCTNWYSALPFQGGVKPGPGRAATGGGGGAPTVTNHTFCTSGATACVTDFTPTSGRALAVFAVSDGNGTAVTCSDDKGNTYTRDSDQTSTTPRGGWFRANSISGSGVYTVTCSGSGSNSNILILEISKGTIALATPTSGTNPTSGDGSSSPMQPAASFTTTDTNVLVLSGAADTTGASGTLTALDSFTVVGTPCSNGSSCFVGVVSQKSGPTGGTYIGGFSFTATSQWVASTVAYK